jgi:hypothetical protein
MARAGRKFLFNFSSKRRKTMLMIEQGQEELHRTEAMEEWLGMKIFPVTEMKANRWHT